MARRSKAFRPLGLAALAFLLGWSPLPAQLPTGPEIQVDSRSGSAFTADVGLAADGSFVATWLREGTLYARLFRPDGTPRGPAIRVTRPIGQGSALSVNPDGSFLVVWPKNTAVVGWRFDKNGRPLGTVFNVNATASGPNDFPSIGRAPDGTYVVAWDRRIAAPTPGDEAPYDVFLRRFAANGTPLSGEVNVTQAHEEQMRPRLAVDAAGRFALAYSNYTGEGTFYDVEARRLGVNGAPRGPVIFVNSEDGEQELSQKEPAIAMAADGRVTILWSGPSGLELINGVYGRQLTADGIPRGPVFRVEEADPWAVLNPAIAMMPDGQFLAVWSRRTSSPGPGRLMAQRYTVDAAPLGAPFAIDRPSAGVSVEGAVALSAEGGGVALWRRFDPATRSDAIVARRLVPSPR